MDDWHEVRAFRHDHGTELRSIREKIYEIVSADPEIPQEDKGELLLHASCEFSPLQLFREAFSRYSKRVGTLFTEETYAERHLNEFSDSTVTKYFQSLMRAAHPVEKFIDRVKETNRLAFPQDLTDAAIDQDFLRTFKDVEGYVRAAKHLRTKEARVVELLHAQGDWPYGGLMATVVLSSSEELDRMNRKVFSDLQGRAAA